MLEGVADGGLELLDAAVKDGDVEEAEHVLDAALGEAADLELAVLRAEEHGLHERGERVEEERRRGLVAAREERRELRLEQRRELLL